MCACCLPCVCLSQSWAQLEWSDGRWMTAVKLLESALQANQNHLPSWMVRRPAFFLLLPATCLHASCGLWSCPLAHLDQPAACILLLDLQTQKLPVAWTFLMHAADASAIKACGAVCACVSMCVHRPLARHAGCWVVQQQPGRCSKQPSSS